MGFKSETSFPVPISIVAGQKTRHPSLVTICDSRLFSPHTRTPIPYVSSEYLERTAYSRFSSTARAMNSFSLAVMGRRRSAASC